MTNWEDYEVEGEFYCGCSVSSYELSKDTCSFHGEYIRWWGFIDPTINELYVEELKNDWK